MKHFLSLMLVLIMFTSNAQVGIGTDDPKAMLDVNGTLKVREIALTESITPEQTVLYIDNTVIGDAVIKKVTTDGLADVLFNSYVGSTILAARKNSGISLLNIGLWGNFQPIIFVESEVTAGNFSLLSDNGYLVPDDGIYMINYSFTYGTGIQVGLLSGTPKISIVKENNSEFEELHMKEFAGVTLAGLASITLSSADLSGLYQLSAGNRIYFGINRGGVSLGLLSSSKASVSIAKIAN